MRKRQFDLCDTPHPRYGCTIFPFSDPPCLSNGSHCSKCWCFFCEEAAPCSQWGSGIMPTDHCNAVASSWIWPTQKFAREEDPNEEHSVMALPPRPSSMSGLSHGLYGPNFYSLPLSTGIRQVDEQRLLHESSAESDCFSSCQSSLVSARPRTDPSTDSQWFEFGTVWIPIEATQPERTMDDLSCSMDKFSLEFFVQNLRENGMIRLYQDDSVEDFFFNSLHQTTHNYKGLLDEIILNEAQGQLQVILSFTSHPENGRLGMANVRIFLKKERGEELLILKELLREMFPHDFSLQQYLVQVEEMRIWAESSTEWMSFAGLLRDLDSADYRDAPQPSGLSVPLRPYQLQSLQFMLDAEQRSGGLLGVNYHPLQSAATGSQLMYSASLSHLMEYRQGNIHGGFLCEEMGLGKTIEILALILSNPCPIENSTLPSLSKGTLIVCPVSIVGQWANEVKSKLAANLSIYMYHGSKRIRDPKKLAKYDIVITTYATLGSDFSKATQATRHGADFAEQFCPLLSVNWWRVVLDESHTVKDPAPLHSRACARLKADRRWCCTGTPINTSIYDLYGQAMQWWIYIT